MLRGASHLLLASLALAFLLTLPSGARSGVIEVVDAGYLTDQHVCVYVVNKGPEPVALKSVYLDGESYKIVTAEEMREHPERWDIPPGKWEGWTWINPGEAFVYEQPIPPGVKANITMRPAVAHFANTRHEVVLIFENGEEVSVEVVCPAGDFTHQATFFTEPFGYMRVFYPDGTNVSLTLDEHPEEFMKILELADQVLAKLVKYVELRPWTNLEGEKHVELASVVPIFLDIPEDCPYPPTGFRVNFVFTGKYAGYVIYHQADCCTSDDVVWELEDLGPLKEFERYIDELPAILRGAATPRPEPGPQPKPEPEAEPEPRPEPTAEPQQPEQLQADISQPEQQPELAPTASREMLFYATCFLVAALLAVAAYKLAAG